eukprot:12734716-Alexandrium_andersonii.AAC.1
MHCHDCIHSDHDKKYECCVTIPLRQLDQHVAQIWRVGQWGKLAFGHLVGRQASETSAPSLAVMIPRGHARML